MKTPFEKQVIEARARIMWGDDISEVKKTLAQQGVSNADVDTVIQLSLQERQLAVRRTGAREMVWGSVFAVVGFVLLLLQTGFGVNLDKIFGLALMLTFWGIWRFSRGIERVFFSKSIKGSLTEL